MNNDIFREIKEIDFNKAPQITQTGDWHSVVNEVKSIIEKKADRTLVSQEASEFDINSDKLPPARFYTDLDSAHLESFFIKGSQDYLVVFFSGARSRSGGKTAPYPTFSSWSWYKDISASILCIDDPMYNTYPETSLGLYYGTKTENYRYATALLIKKIASLLNLDNKNIILYGRSGGGAAAIAVSDFIDGCCVCAINSIFDIENYKWYSKQFAEITGVDYSSEDFKKRNDLVGIIKKHEKSCYLLIENLFSDLDVEVQIPYILKNFNIEIRYGISSDSNLFLWSYAAWGVSAAHNSFDSVSLFKIIFDIIVAISNSARENDVNFLARAANDFWFERYNHLIKRSQYEKEIDKLNKLVQDKAPDNKSPKSENSAPQSSQKRAENKFIGSINHAIKSLFEK